MVLAYWQIGKMIFEKQGETPRAEYGAGLINELSDQMTKDFGKGFNKRNLELMRQFYLTFPNANALRTELNWPHYRLLMRVEDSKSRDFYLEECIKTNWSTRFENMSNSPTIFFLVKYANALDTELDVILKGVNLVEISIIDKTYR